MILSLLEPFLQEHSELIELELALVILLSLAAVVAIVIRRARLPYTVALVLVGLILSFFPNLLNIDVSSELILSLLVPPLIFEATLNLRWSKLRQDLLPILLLALVGTLASSFIVAGIVGFLGEALLPDLDLPFAAVFAFGALISATDPVAVISFFRSLGVGKRLTILVEGESLFNDGVAIVLFNIALGIGILSGSGAGEASGDAFNLVRIIAEFLLVALGGLAIGASLGLFVSYGILKNVDDHLIETATTVALAFGSFVLAEEFHVSGLLSVVAAGLFVGNVGTENTSPTSKFTLENFWEFLAFVVNSLVFLLIGLETDLNDLEFNLELIFIAVLAVLISRAIVIYSLTWLHGRLDQRHSIPWAYRHVMYWGGLRGAISLALALGLTSSSFDPAITDQLRVMAFGVVLFTLLFQGTTISRLLRYLGLADKPKQELMQQRRQAQLYAARAGKRELDRLHHDGILSTEVWQAMRDVYDREIERHNRELRDLLRYYAELEQGMVLQARRELLRAERAAMSDAVVRGLISENVYRELIKETDSLVAALDLIAAGHPEEQTTGKEG